MFSRADIVHYPPRLLHTTNRQWLGAGPYRKVASVKELSLPNDKGGKSRRARHGKFKVAGSVLSAEQVGNRAACERALEKAKSARRRRSMADDHCN
jgi:hypothetical protein